VRSYVDESEVAFRGSAPEGPGYWMAPTVLETSDTKSRAFQEEIFGPVVSVVRFKDEDEAIAIANASPYGLSGSIWSRDIGRALRVARGVETGALSVNSNSLGALLDAIWRIQAVRTRPRAPVRRAPWFQ